MENSPGGTGGVGVTSRAGRAVSGSLPGRDGRCRGHLPVPRCGAALCRRNVSHCILMDIIDNSNNDDDYDYDNDDNDNGNDNGNDNDNDNNK